MQFTIKAKREGKEINLHYDNVTNEVTDEEGNVLNPLFRDPRVPPIREGEDVVQSRSFLPNENSNTVSRKLSTLDITLGLNCNFNCGYCSQRPVLGKGYSAKPSDVEPFVAMLDRNGIELSSEGRVNLWGGEPLLYWKTIVKLVPLLRERYPTQVFEIITNGSLLTKDKIDFCNRWNIMLSVSDDGINEHRCDSAVESARKQDELYEYAAKTMGKRFFFGVVPSKGNANVIKIIDTMRSRVPSIKSIYTDNVLKCFTAEDRDGVPANVLYRMSDADLVELHDSRFVSLMERYNSGDKSQKTFRASLAVGMPEVERAQCGIGVGRMLCVNLRGDIYSCHAFAAKGEELGHLDALSDVVIKHHTSSDNRPMCKECLLFSLCRGDCSRLSNEAHMISCENRYASFYPVFRKIFSEMFGIWVDAVEPQGPQSRVMQLLNYRNPTMDDVRSSMIKKKIPIFHE